MKRTVFSRVDHLAHFDIAAQAEQHHELSGVFARAIGNQIDHTMHRAVSSGIQRFSGVDDAELLDSQSGVYRWKNGQSSQRNRGMARGLWRRKH